MGFDRKYLAWALAYVVAGMCLGIFMGASHDHNHRVTHAHVLLVGFVVSMIYGVIHKLWLTQPAPGLSATQFWVHQLGAFLMSVGLFLLYGGHVDAEKIDGVLAVSSIVVLLGAVLMLVLVVKSAGTHSVKA